VFRIRVARCVSVIGNRHAYVMESGDVETRDYGGNNAGKERSPPLSTKSRSYSQ